MNSLRNTSKHPLQRGFIALLLLVIFLALAIVLPKLLTMSADRGFSISIGYIDVKYQWVSNESLILFIRNNYSKTIILENIKCGLNEYYLNKTIVKPGEVVVIKLENIYINRTCLTTLVYRIDNFKYGKLFVINTPISSNSESKLIGSK